MPQKIEIPGIDVVEFPDGMNDDAIVAAIKRQFGDQQLAKYDAGGNLVPAKAPAPASIDDFGRQLAKGVPVVGGLMEKAAAGADAATQPVLGRGSPAGTFGERYDANLATEQARDKQFESGYPGASAALQLTGGTAALAPVAATSIGARALGNIGTLAARIPRGGASGGALGAGDAWTRGNDPLTGGALGAGIGAASPVGGRLIGAGVNRIAEALAKVPKELRDLSRPVRKALVERHLPGTEQQLAELGPQAFMFEGNPASFNLAQGVVAARPGKAQARMLDAVTQRHGGTVRRLDADVNANFGPAERPGFVEEGFQQQREQVGKLYGPASHGQQGLDTRNIVRKLDEEIAQEAGASRNALREVKGVFYGPHRIELLDGRVIYSGDKVNRSDLEKQFGSEEAAKIFKELDSQKLKSDVYELHRARMALDDLYKKTGETPVAQGLVLKYRQQLDDLMPPGVKRVDDLMSDLFGQSDQLKRGATVMRAGPEAPWPEELRAGVKNPEQEAALRTGVRADIHRAVRTKANDLAELKKFVQGEGDWNRDKLAALFGQDEADKVFKAIDREQAFTNAYNKLKEGSQTEMRRGATKVVDALGGEDKPVPPIWDRIGQIPEAIAKPAWNFLRDEVTGLRRAKADEGLARVYTTQGAERDRVAAALADYEQRLGRATPYATAADRITQLLALSAGIEAPRQLKQPRQ